MEPILHLINLIIQMCVFERERETEHSLCFSLNNNNQLSPKTKKKQKSLGPGLGLFDSSEIDYIIEIYIHT